MRYSSKHRKSSKKLHSQSNLDKTDIPKER